MKKINDERRAYSLDRYVRIKGGFIVKVDRVGPNALLAGFRVNRYGVKICRETKTHEQEFLHVFTPRDIVAELRLNLHYAELETVREPTEHDR